ncbi:MAG: type II toxin-antitoxin system VapC family toxin [candidate division KSB1 bacterium]|nr:type II toxin-antitoxin system VapC family toxin [candidate division KSB1 bacterium]MDQ7063061.1 type II toxin-antitoxin system VapC family toxin [candidate division KSB1 bacterium]
MLVDTDVLIWYMRGNDNARRTIQERSHIKISVISYMELLQGLRNKREFSILRKTLQQWKTEILHIDMAISLKAMFYFEQHFLSHALKIADSLIAATAVVHHLPLLTANDKHYRMIKDLHIQLFRPS